MGAASATLRFDIAAAGTPAWATQIADAVWSQIATGSGSGNAGGNTISAVLPSPLPQVGNLGGDAVSVTNAWCGGFFDSDNGEYGFCANGGHADYVGNEVYVLALRVATPSWRRIIDPTPNSVMAGAAWQTEASTWPDGRSRAMHNSFQVWADGRIWMPYQNSVTSQGGGGEQIACSFNRASLGVALSPQAWANNPGPWNFFGAIPVISGVDPGSTKFGSCCYDRVNKKVWAAGGSNINVPTIWSIVTAGGSLGQMNGFTPGGSGFGAILAMACAYDLGIVIGFDINVNKFGYFNVSNPGAGWIVPTNIAGTQPVLGHVGSYATPDQSCGAVYYQPQHSVVIMDPPRLGNQLYRLQIPTSGGAFNPTGQWVWTNSTPSGPAPSIGVSGSGATGNTQTYSKFNLCEDIGNGQSCLIYCFNYRGPTAVYKIPTTGFPF